ncbi:dipeptidyl aminopeptidase/acylaminoacyl peptidase [Aequorivita sublithincola DSM 14238]|uniref:Dipeptidyl aminopeptidase/acylaminoacyl peptidase n=1 Tax=Aequorivita sublithincola (strain DSM 14238 / LMG 21431 / ACAM 643 / 9-3) TaxID=746697 RepID=I3YUW7_AEQSU|nr:S9 family peptidase [Aequorivita sublithincola]AFL80785.1 dipeptidyl aminopeptidase/acylaminoacyl peptidase [Aequorivita sublithincola DSM 14238]
MTTLLKYTIAITVLFLSGTINAQELNGSYSGTLDVQGMQMELIINITPKDNGYTATLDVPAQGASDIVLDSVVLQDNQVTITSAKMKLIYKGTVSGESIVGSYEQMGQTYPLTLKKTVKTKPGNTALPSTDAELEKLAAMETGNYKYSVEDYFKTPDVFSFNLSPDGKYLSYMKRRETGERDVYLKETATQKERLLIKQGENLIRGFFWANENRILFLQDKGGNENYHLFGVNVDGSNKNELTPYEGVRVGVLEMLKDDKDHIIIQMNKDNLEQEEPYRLNINTGEATKLYTVEAGSPPVAGYAFDQKGNLRGIGRMVDGVNIEMLYKIDGEFKPMMVVDFVDSFGISDFNPSSENPDDAYVLSNLGTDKAEIQLYDLKKNEKIKTIFKNDNFDVSGLSLSRKRNYEIDFFYYQGEKTEVVPVSDTYRKIYARLKKEFGDKQFFTQGKTDDESKYLVVITSDKIVGEYYLYDVEKDTITLLYKILPNLKAEDMASMTPITFKSRDGLTLHGYITLPQGYKKGQKLPLIVNPHGGPQGIRDSWGFNPEAQLFASRGYATLHVNFRISGGYGKEFQNSGYGQIGRKAMDDVEDGIAYVIKEGWVDKNKVAIYGGSHGGYAVLRGMTKTPDLYACGVDYVGVSNLHTFMETIPPYWEKYKAMLYKIWYNPTISEEKAIMDEVSPALHVDKIKKPLFVVQGANDPRVNIDEADQIVESLRKRGVEVPYMVKYDEGHGFGKEENRLALYETMMGFFAEHLK